MPKWVPILYEDNELMLRHMSKQLLGKNCYQSVYAMFLFVPYVLIRHGMSHVRQQHPQNTQLRRMLVFRRVLRLRSRLVQQLHGQLRHVLKCDDLQFMLGD